MPFEIPNIASTPDDETERLLDRPVAYQKPAPNALSSMAARAAQGLAESSTAILHSIVTRPDDGTSPKLSVNRLYTEYPNMHWDNPLTREQAEWRYHANRERAGIAGIIDRREQGVTSTVAGYGVQLVTQALASPETYLAPGVGKLLTGTVTKLSPFAAGFVGDVALTAAITEPLNVVRENLLENPYGATEYFTNVAASAAVSGLLNFGAYALINYGGDPKVSAQVHSETLLNTVTGQPNEKPTPGFAHLARQEQALTDTYNQWIAGRTPEEVQLVHDPRSKFISGVTEDGTVIVNTARASNPTNLARALTRAGETQAPKDLGPTARLTSTGYEILPGKEPVSPYTVLPDRAPNTEYNLAHQKQDIIEIQKSRFIEETGDQASLAPEDISKAVMIDPLEETFGFSIDQMDPLVTPERLAPPTPTADGASVEVHPTKQAFDVLPAKAKFVVKAVDDAAEAARTTFNSVRETLSRWRKAGADKARRNLDMSEMTDLERQFIDDMDLSFRTLQTMTDDELLANMAEQYRRTTILEAHRTVLQAEAVERLTGLAKYKKKIGNALHAFFDGSLRRGVDNADNFGGNVWRRMETLRSSYSNLIHATVDKYGIRRHLDDYSEESRAFWTEVDKSLHGIQVTDEAAREVGKVVAAVREHARVLLNRQGAGIRKRDAYFLAQTHDRSKVIANKDAWVRHLMDEDVVDWSKMGYVLGDDEAKLSFLEYMYDSIVETPDMLQVNDMISGLKGQKFSRARELEFKPGKIVEYNDKFGNTFTSRALLDQIELQGKAIALTEHFGPDVNAFRSEVVSAMHREDVPVGFPFLGGTQSGVLSHFDQMTGASNTAVNQPLAQFAATTRSWVNAIYLYGTGITTALSDPVAMAINLRTRGLAKSMGQASRMVLSNYGEGARAARGVHTPATKKLELSLVIADTNLMAMRKALGDIEAVRGDGLGKKLSLQTIKWSGTAYVSKAAQYVTMIGDQRAMARMLSGDLPLDSNFIYHLKRHGVTLNEFKSLSPFVLDGQLSVFDIADTNLRRRMQNFLHEGMQTGSLQADPMQTALTQMGTKTGTWKGEGNRLATMYLASTFAVQEKLLMRLAVMNGGDARFLDLVKRARLVETVSAMGMMLGSAATIVTVKDALRNKEPFFLGDKPADFQTMKRIVKISGILPLGTEFMDTIQGGITGQMAMQLYDVAASVNDGKGPWSTLAEARKVSPFIGTTVGPMPAIIDALVAFASEDFTREMLNRQRSIQKSSGQAPLF